MELVLLPNSLLVRKGNFKLVCDDCKFKASCFLYDMRLWINQGLSLHQLCTCHYKLVLTKVIAKLRISSCYISDLRRAHLCLSFTAFTTKATATAQESHCTK